MAVLCNAVAETTAAQNSPAILPGSFDAKAFGAHAHSFAVLTDMKTSIAQLLRKWTTRATVGGEAMSDAAISPFSPATAVLNLALGV